jgi:hypothetical protein
MAWATYLLLALRIFLVARQFGPEVAGLYRDITAMIKDLRTGGAVPASTEYFQGQAKAELARLRGLKSRDPSYLKSLHQQVSAVRDRSIK